MERAIINKGEIIEANAKDAPVKDIHWDATQAQTDSVPIIDPGVGKAVVLRHFFFKSQPVPKGYPKPDKLQILSQFKRLIEMSLWGDGLIIREDKPIEVHNVGKVKKISKTLYMKMKDEGADFVILCLASPRMGVSVVDKVHQAK